MAGYRKCSRTKIRAVGVICRCASVWWAGFLRVVPHGHQPQPSLQEGRHDLQPWTRPASLRGWVGGAAGGLASARRGGGGGGRWRGPDRGRDGEVRRRTHLLQISVCVLGSFGAWVCFSTLSLSLSAQGLPDHPGAGSVRGRGFGPGWRGSVGAVAWSQGRRRGGHEEEGQGAGHQWTSEERTALRWEGLQLDSFLWINLLKIFTVNHFRS